MWDIPRPGLEPVSPALAGRFSTTAPPGKPYKYLLNEKRYDDPSSRLIDFMSTNMQYLFLSLMFVHVIFPLSGLSLDDKTVFVTNVSQSSVL